MSFVFFAGDSPQRPLHSNEDLICQVPDIEAECNFYDFRSPNEGTPIGVKPHLDRMEKGWIVSTGTERSFYDLILSPDGMCDGLIIRDINPKVKAYCDFLILLLWVSENNKEFLSFRENKTSDHIREPLLKKIEQMKMSSKLKSYFRENFDMLAGCYLDQRHTPFSIGTGSNEEVEYHQDNGLFLKLQRYARAGKIIATVGNINDLAFTAGRKITVIDVSNIPDYIFIRPEGYGDVTPRIIFTNQDYITKYYSGLYERASECEIQRMDAYIEMFISKDQKNERLKLHIPLNPPLHSEVIRQWIPEDSANHSAVTRQELFHNVLT